jgi:hypothetical protein
VCATVNRIGGTESDWRHDGEGGTVVELGGAVAVPGGGLALTVTCAPKKLSYGL